jgi:hypothetical protein
MALQEKVMLNKLRFNLSCPTPYVFLIRFLRVVSSSAADSSDHHGDHHNTQVNGISITQSNQSVI